MPFLPSQQEPSHANNFALTALLCCFSLLGQSRGGRCWKSQPLRECVLPVCWLVAGRWCCVGDAFCSLLAESQAGCSQEQELERNTDLGHGAVGRLCGCLPLKNSKWTIFLPIFSSSFKFSEDILGGSN